MTVRQKSDGATGDCCDTEKATVPIWDSESGNDLNDEAAVVSDIGLLGASSIERGGESNPRGDGVNTGTLVSGLGGERGAKL